MHPTGGSRRVFKQFVWLGAGSGKLALSRPTHQRVTPAVSLLNILKKRVMIHEVDIRFDLFVHNTFDIL